MCLNLNGMTQLALAKVAIQIEITAGPLNSSDVQDHEERVAKLDAAAVQAKRLIQDHCEHDFPGLESYSNLLMFCRKCRAKAWGPDFEKLVEHGVDVHQVGEIYSEDENGNALSEKEKRKWFVSVWADSPMAASIAEVPEADTEDEAWELIAQHYKLHYESKQKP